jgi:DNA-binding SARP family transcriptional activator
MSADYCALLLTDDPATADLVHRAVAPLETKTMRLQDWPGQVDRNVRVVVLDMTRSREHEATLLRVRNAGVPVVALLASAAETDLARGADDIVLWPLDVKELSMRVQRLIRLALSNRAPLRIYLAGPVRVQIGDETPIDCHYRRRRAKALLVYLYLRRGRLVSKYQVMTDLWPEAETSDPGRVKHTIQVLRATLDRAQRTYGASYILEHDGAYAFNADAERWSDVEEFESQLAMAAHARTLGRDDEALERYCAALALRPQMFLAEFRYDDWAIQDVDRLQDLFVGALEAAAELESAHGAHDRAVDYLRRAILEDPLRERSHSHLMRELWLGGRRVEALRAYDHLRQALARTLDIKPHARTTRLYEAIRRDQQSAA